MSGTTGTAVSGAIARRRAELYRETPFETAERVVLGTAWALKPRRIHHIPPLLKMWAKSFISPAPGLPDPEVTYTDLGLAGLVSDYSLPTLIEAYHRGLFIEGHFGTQHWSSPPERCVLFFDEYHIGKTVRRLMRRGKYRVTFDQDFEGVIKACAGRRPGMWHLTWLTPTIMRAFTALYDAGHVHSFEVWNERNELVGGGYGVALGRIFFTESQFSHERDTSKLGFAALNWHLAKWRYVLNDGKMPTPTITPMGFRNIPRAEFRRLLDKHAHEGGKPGRWSVEAGLNVVETWEPAPKRAMAAE
jgi:leucyl/phenylalanyl-tRNA--protein transferase